MKVTNSGRFVAATLKHLHTKVTHHAEIFKNNFEARNAEDHTNGRYVILVSSNVST